MNKLQLIKSADFGGTTCDIYGEGNEVYMTSEQLGECLEYSDKRAISKLVSRNEYLKSTEFSCVVKMATESGAKGTRIFTEDGIYEVTMLAKTNKAKEFRAWVRVLLKSLRTGNYSQPPMTQIEILQQSVDVLAKQDKRISDLESRQFEMETKIDTALSVPQDWETKITENINNIVTARKLSRVSYLGMLYKRLECEAGCNLESRRTKYVNRLKKSGATYKDCKAVTKLQIIANDSCLKTVFEEMVNCDGRACN